MEILVAGDCIFYVKELLSPELCRGAIENYERDPRRHPGYTVGSRGAEKSYDDVKVSTDLSGKSPEPSPRCSRGAPHASGAGR